MKTVSSVFPMTQLDDRLGLPQTLAYALPMVSVSFLLGPIVILQGIYAKYFGLSLTTIATVILIARLFDAVTDPVIGYLSDHYRRRTGSRKRFVVGGGVLFVLSSYFLYTPGSNVSTMYFLGWFLAFYLAWTLFEIPHLAWGAELAPHSIAKNRIYSFRALGSLIGQLLFYTVPLLPFFATNEFTPQTLTWSAIAAGLFMLPLLYICINTTPNGSNILVVDQQKSRENISSDHRLKLVLSFLATLIDNKPFLLFMTMHVSVGIGVGMWFTIIYIFVDAYLILGDKLALAYIISLCISTLTVGVWSAIAARLGKKITWSFALLLMAIGIASTGLLTPGEASFVPLVMIHTLIMFGFAAYQILAPSLLADIVDYGTWKFGVDRGATYFSMFTLLNKVSMAVGGSLGLVIAGWYGFDPAAITHTADAIFGLRLAISWLPAPIVLLAVVLVALIPINARRHAIIRRRLNARADRAQAAKRLSLVPLIKNDRPDTTELINSETSLTPQVKL